MYNSHSSRVSKKRRINGTGVDEAMSKKMTKQEFKNRMQKDIQNRIRQRERDLLSIEVARVELCMREILKRKKAGLG